MRVVGSGGTLYLFDEDDPRANEQVLACAASNLDVDTWTIPASRWINVLQAARQMATVIECRDVPEKGWLMGVNHVTGQPIECIEVDEAGAALAGAIDFQAGTLVFIELQRQPGAEGVFGWEAKWLTGYQERGWRTDCETVFRVGGSRYVTLNLPNLENRQ